MKILQEIANVFERSDEIKATSNFNIPSFFNLEIKKDDFEVYTLWILDSLIKSKADLSFHHIMIPELSEEKRKSLVTKMIFYFVILELESLSVSELETISIELQSRIRKGVLDQNGLKGTSLKFKKLLTEQKQRRTLKKFLDELVGYLKVHQSNHRNPQACLFNMLTKDKKYVLENIPDYMFIYQEIESLKLYSSNVCPLVILNSSEDLRGLDEASPKIDLFDYIQNVILFGVEGRSTYRSFNFQAIRDLNEQEGTIFNNLVVVSFVKKYSLNKALNKLQRVNSDFYFRTTGLDFNAYAVHPLEMRNESSSDFLPIQIIERSSELYEVLISQIRENEELNELLSVRIRNIYSLCFSIELKNYILEMVFSPESSLIHEETVDALSSLNENEHAQLKITIEMLLDNFLISQYNSNIFNLCETKYQNILIPHEILINAKFVRLLSQALGDDKSFTSWRVVFDSEPCPFLILAYRDTGGFPFRITPNIHEFPIIDYPESTAVFRQELFSRNYHYTLVEYWGTTFKYLLNNPLRYANFKLDSLIKELDQLRPDKHETYDLYDIDNNYSREYDSRFYRIEIEGSKPRKYTQSDQFLVRHSEQYSVLRADDLCEDYDELANPKIQLLESMYLGLNLFESTQAEKEEILALKRRYNLNHDDIENRLWKVVLNRKVETEGLDQVYNLITNTCIEKGGSMVSKSHFENNWLDASSSSVIPRSKKTFLALVEILDLPIAYYKVMLKQRAKIKLETRRSSSKMNSLIIDLVENGLFNTSGYEVTSLDDIAARHPLEEIGIVEENHREELVALVALVKDNIRPEYLLNIVEE